MPAGVGGAASAADGTSSVAPNASASAVMSLFSMIFPLGLAQLRPCPPLSHRNSPAVTAGRNCSPSSATSGAWPTTARSTTPTGRAASGTGSASTTADSTTTAEAGTAAPNLCESLDTCREQCQDGATGQRGSPRGERGAHETKVAVDCGGGSGRRHVDRGGGAGSTGVGAGV